MKWRKRASTADLPTGPKEPKSTVLSVEEEAVIVAFRRYTLLPLDDCLYALQPTIPNLTRSSLHRCLQRHGIGRLPDETLVLPAHERPFYGLETRAKELTDHHLDTLDRLQAFCSESPGSVVALARKLFPDRRSLMDDILAISETLAHLAYLLAQGRVTKHRMADGSDQYRVAGGSA